MNLNPAFRSGDATPLPSNVLPGPGQAVPNVVHFEGLSKRFGPVHALRSVSLQLAAGRVSAVVGPNGSGKSTLIKCLLGLVRPDSGTVLVHGKPCSPRFDHRSLIGYMPQEARFPENLRVREVLQLVCELRTPVVEPDRVLLREFGLEAELEKRVRTLSGGTRQRLSAVVALQFQPEILVLDEPTAGLDPIYAGVLKARIDAERAAGSTVLLTSHIMSEVEALADDIIFLLEGSPVFAGPAGTLKRRTGEPTLERAVAAMMQEGAP